MENTSFDSTKIHRNSKRTQMSRTEVIPLGVISIFLRAIVLQTDSPTECIDKPTLRVGSPAKPILVVFSPTNRWSYSTVGLLIGWSRPVIVSPTLFRTIDTLVETSVS